MSIELTLISENYAVCSCYYEPSANGGEKVSNNAPPASYKLLKGTLAYPKTP